jgi:HEAT repeat protein
MINTMRRLRAGVIAALLLASVSPRPAAAQQADGRTQQFDDLAAHRATLPLDQLATLLHEGLADPDAAIRARALAAIAGRAGAVRFSQDGTLGDTWRAERPLLLSLEPAAIHALDDTVPEVRRQAILALGNLAFVLGTNDPPLAPALMRAFADRFARETDPAVRADLTYAVATASTRTDGRDALLVAALDDSEPTVQAAALVGLTESSPPAALPGIAARLGSTDPTVRLNAAVAMQGYGAAARTYAARLRTALAAEKDPAIAGTLRAALEAAGAR